MRGPAVHNGYFVPQATPLAVQNMFEVSPTVAPWHMGSVGSWQSVLAVHFVVQAANSWLLLEQLKQVVPVAQGFPHSAAYVVQTPCTHATPGVSLNWIVDPSSVVGAPSAQPQAG